jgi:hypothetical protein
MIVRAFTPLLTTALLLTTPALADETIATLTLDGLSFISFGDEEVLPIAPGGTLRFHLQTPSADGSVPFTIGIGDVNLAEVDSSQGALKYALAAPTSGVIQKTADGRKIEFTAAVTVTLTGPSESGTFTYTIPFSTESAAATDLSGQHTVSRTGARLVEGVWYVQLVGATTNKENAFPEPGAAVYTVLSGQFDTIP